MNKKKCLLTVNGISTRGGHRFCGFTDPPLSAEGRQAVMGLRDRLLNAKDGLPKIWYLSDRRRTVESFEVLTAGMQAPIVRLTDRLREINFGDYENLTWDELPPDFQRSYELAMSAPMPLRFPNGESFYEMCERVTTGALDILSFADDDSDIGILGHQGSIRLWQLLATGQEPREFFNNQPDFATASWASISVADVASWRQRYMAPRTEYTPLSSLRQQD
jgi:broad specificity phosphatase PhoE